MVENKQNKLKHSGEQPRSQSIKNAQRIASDQQTREIAETLHEVCESLKDINKRLCTLEETCGGSYLEEQMQWNLEEALSLSKASLNDTFETGVDDIKKTGDAVRKKGEWLVGKSAGALLSKTLITLAIFSSISSIVSIAVCIMLFK